MPSICCWISSQLCSTISSGNVGKGSQYIYCSYFIFYLFIYSIFGSFACRIRGVLAEGAQFMMMSPQYDFQQVHPELNEIRSFNFFRMIKPNNPDLVDLQRKLGVCGTKRGQSCRLVSVYVHFTYNSC